MGSFTEGVAEVRAGFDRCREVDTRPNPTLAAIRDELTPKVTGHDARQVLAIVLAIQESSRSGVAVAP